ncbi:DMT family transporter [Bradyrhizobium sp. LHD-71]|uniref:DMT family transporter n=1 Tax=Bradyrhizobium sp. LHD-71 TaxID=3072141 RepID=UPI00280FEC4F|nr:DMT family transporter [Bradyrhizobium sp. LHD-71]MDQ8727229.1 DMT family transporter [Bradyrhizobium sp. LHD-71]
MPSQGLPLRRALVLLCLVALAWGASWPITKMIVREMSPLWSSSFRCAIAAVVLASLLLVRRQFVIPKRGDMPVVLSTSLLHMTAFSALVAAGLQFLPAGRASVLGYATPIWVTIGARIFLSESITMGKAIGVLTGLTGLGVIFSPGSLDWSDRHALIGTGLVVLAAFCWAANIVYVRAHTWISSPFQLAFWQVTLAFVVLSIAALMIDGIPRVTWTPRLVGLLLFSGIICTALAHWAMSVVNRSLPAVTTSLGLLATPALGIVGGIAILGEPIDPSLLFALALLVGGIWIGMTNEKRTSHSPAE